MCQCTHVACTVTKDLCVAHTWGHINVQSGIMYALIQTPLICTCAETLIHSFYGKNEYLASSHICRAGRQSSVSWPQTTRALISWHQRAVSPSQSQPFCLFPPLCFNFPQECNFLWAARCLAFHVCANVVLWWQCVSLSLKCGRWNVQKMI